MIYITFYHKRFLYLFLEKYSNTFLLFQLLIFFDEAGLKFQILWLDQALL